MMILWRSTVAVALFLNFLGLSAAQTEERNVGSFNSLAVTGNIRVELYKAKNPSLVIEIDGTTSENVISENEDQRLSLRLKTNTPKEAKIRILVYYTDLNALEVQAQALITSPDTLSGSTFTFDAKSGGKMELKLNITEVTADVRQGAILVFTGRVEKQTIVTNTGGTYSAYQLEARDTYVKAVAGGKAKVVARHIIDATASAKGFVGYFGDPVSTFTKTSLGGEIANFRNDTEI